MSGVLALLIDIGSIASFVFGIKLLVRIRASRRGLALVVGGVALAALGALVELGKMPPVTALIGAAGGGLMGAVANRRGPSRPGPAVRLWGAGLGGLASAVVACGVMVERSGVPALLGGLAGMAGLAGALLAWHATRSASALLGAGAAGAGGAAVALLGFALASPLLIMAGALATGTAMALRRIGRAASRPATSFHEAVHACDPEEAAMVLEAARRVMIIPGYGMAVAQAHHALRELAERLAADVAPAGVSWVIHPAAGRIPGHMNVLLDEANVPQAHLLDVTAANARLRAGEVDVALVIGADDIVNPDALRDDDGPLYGLEIVEVYLAHAVLVVKRTLDPSEAGVRNPLFEKPNTTLVFGDCKRVVGAIAAALKDAHRAAA